MHKKYFFFDIDGTLSTGLTTMMPESLFSFVITEYLLFIAF